MIQHKLDVNLWKWNCRERLQARVAGGSAAWSPSGRGDRLPGLGELKIETPDWGGPLASPTGQERGGPCRLERFI